jgi:hypothetical protein
MSSDNTVIVVIKKMKIKSFLIVLALIMLVSSLGVAQAFGGNLFGMGSESRGAIENAIKAKDYNTWKEAMAAELTEENFNKLVERQETMSVKQAQREAMEKAIQEEDYEAWKNVAENSSVNSSKILDEDHFKILVQLYQAKQDGNYTKVRELSEQLGLFGGVGKQKMFGDLEEEGYVLIFTFFYGVNIA